MVGLAKKRVMGVSGALLILMALVLMLAAPAVAIEGNCTALNGGWNVGVTSGPWGSITDNGNGSVSVTLNPGYSLELCVKGGNGYLIYEVSSSGGPFWPPSDCGQGAGQCGLSHWGVRDVQFTTTTTAEETTTTAEETTTTAEETTTTAEETTTTTVEETTTTAEETTTTTAEVGGTTVTTSASTTTTEPPVTVSGIVVTLPSNPQVSNTTAGTLPFTGLSTGSVAVIGAALTAMGALLLVASRRGEDKSAVRSWS